MDSTSPVIFRRTKAKPAGRTRPTSPESTKNEISQENPEEAPITLATKVKNKVKKSRPKSKLSFGGEEEEVSKLIPLYIYADDG
jgi:GC-rich sequence DNA-binding factor